MFERRCFWFAYAVSRRRTRTIDPHQMRDGEAALYLMSALAERGYRLAETIRNYPAELGDPDPFDESTLTASDLLLLTTRPPMHDHQLGDKRGMRRSNTPLERTLFEGVLATRFRSCARSEIVLSDATAAISSEIAKRQSVLFRQNAGATYQSYGSPAHGWTRFRERTPLTACYLVYAEHAWPGGPGLLAAFGPGGNETLAWAYLLARKYSSLLCTTSFAMAELRTQRPVRPATMAFVDRWEVNILGAAPCEPLRRRKRAA